ncbi:hypothetical protein N9891_00425 [bacterium]|nr:hypothetical protein [bacterium]
MFRWISPRNETFYLPRNGEEGYARTSEKNDYRLVVEEVGNGVLSVSYEPRTRVTHYIYAALVGLIFGAGQWQVRKTGMEGGNWDDAGSLSNDPFRKDPCYEDFLAEDSNRRLSPRLQLEKEFQSWKLNRENRDEMPE